MTDTSQKSLLYIVSRISKLSDGEFEVLKAICKGNSYTKIAADRYVDIGTIKRQTSRILKKFDAKNMSSLVKLLTDLRALDLFE